MKHLDFINAFVLPYKGDDCLIWPYGRNSQGYPTIYLASGKPTGMRAICELAHGVKPTPTHQAAHSCGKGHEGCVNPRHLSWKTPKENMADRLIHGTADLGERNHRAKLTADDVRNIRSLRGKDTHGAIAAIYGVGREAITKIMVGKRWKHIQ